MSNLMTFLVRMTFALTVTIALNCPASARDQVLEAGGLCHQIEGHVNALVDYTTTKCLPAENSEGIAFIIISQEPVFSVEASKKGWLIAVVGAVGYVMNAHPEIKAGPVFVSDMRLMENRKAYRFPGTVAKALQRKAKADELEPDEFYRKLETAMREHLIPKK